MKKKSILSVVLAGVLALGLVGCGAGSTGNTDAGSSAEDMPPDEDKRLQAAFRSVRKAGRPAPPKGWSHR